MKKSCRNVVGFQFKFDFKKIFKSLCVVAFPYFLCTHITVEKFYQFKLSYGKSLWAKAIWLLTQFELPSIWGRYKYDCGVCNQKMLNYLLLNIHCCKVHYLNCASWDCFKPKKSAEILHRCKAFGQNLHILICFWTQFKSMYLQCPYTKRSDNLETIPFWPRIRPKNEQKHVAY